MRHETRAIYAAARKVLTPKEFEAWDIKHRLEWSYQDIATYTDADRSTVIRRVKRAELKIHNELTKEAA